MSEGLDIHETISAKDWFLSLKMYQDYSPGWVLQQAFLLFPSLSEHDLPPFAQMEPGCHSSPHQTYCMQGIKVLHIRWLQLGIPSFKNIEELTFQKDVNVKCVIVDAS